MKKLLSREGATDVYLTLLFSLFLLVSAPYTMIAEVKFASFLALSTAYLILIAILSIKERSFPVPIPLALFTAGYFAFTLISALLSPYEYDFIIGESRYEGLLTQLIYCLSFLSVSAFGRLRERQIWLFAAAMTLFCALSVTQFLGLDLLGFYPKGMSYLDGNVRYSGEYFGTLGNADFSSVLLAMASAAFVTAIFTMKSRKRLLLTLPLVLCLACLLWARVAEGIVGLAASLAITAPVIVSKRSKRAAWILAGAEALAIVVALCAVYLHDVGGGTLHELHELMHGRAADSFGSGRIGIWRAVAEEIKARPFFGGGPDSMMNWELTPFSREVGGKTIYRYIDAAHNEYLNIAAQQGIPALLCAFGALFYCVRSFIKNGGSAVAFSAALAYAFAAFFGISMCILTPVFLAFLAVSRNKEEKL